MENAPLGPNPGPLQKVRRQYIPGWKAEPVLMASR